MAQVHLSIVALPKTIRIWTSMPNGICHPLKNDPRVLSRKSTVSNKTSDPTHLENDIGFLIQIAGENLKQTVFG